MLAQPKRAAVLAYLSATQTANGAFHRRDSLLALFWPELSERRGRDALNSTIYFLRKSLGEGIIIGRGGEELGIAPGSAWCDAHEFDRLRGEGQHEEALRLYTAELLSGFHVFDAPEFEAWIAAERDRFRRGARDSAIELAQKGVAIGDAVRAMRWFRRASEVDPDDERATRHLMQLLESSGDPGAALQVYETLVDRRRRLLDLDPAPQTLELAKEIRARQGLSRVPVHADPQGGSGDQRADLATIPRDAVGDAPDTPNRVGDGMGVVPLPSRRRPGLTTAAALTAFGLTAAAAWGVVTARKPGTPPARDHRVSLAVMPFTYSGNSTGAFLGEGLARLLGTSLDGVGELRIVDARAITGAAGVAAEALDTGAAAEQSRRLADRLGAALYVTGSLVEADGQVSVHASLYDRRQTAPLARLEVRAGREHLFGVVDSLALALLANLPTSPGERIERIAARTTSSLPAMRAYLAGEGAFRRGRYAEAIESFRSAVTADSTFALALYRLSNALTWSRVGIFMPPDSLAAAAVRHATKLPQRDQQLFRAWYSYLHGDAVSAEQRYREVLSSRPDDVEALFYLGEVLFHWGPMFGKPQSDARKPFERVAAFEPENAGALEHLIRLTAASHSRDSLRALVERFSALHPDHAELFEAQMLAAYATGDSARQLQFEASLETGSSRDARRVAWTIAVYAQDPEGTLRLLHRLSRQPFEPFARRLSRLALAEQLVALGRPGEAMASLTPDDVITQARALEYRTMIATLPFVSTPRDSLAALEQALRRQGDSLQGIGPGQYSLPNDRIYAPRRQYLLGLLRLRQGDVGGATLYASQLAVWPATNAMDRAFAADFGRLLNAEALLSRGRREEALQVLGLPGVESDSNLTELTSYPKAHERFLRGEILLSLGRLDDARRWFETFPDPQVSDLMYVTVAQQRVGEIAVRRGDRHGATVAYERVVARWQRAESLFLARRDDAASRLRQLRR